MEINKTPTTSNPESSISVPLLENDLSSISNSKLATPTSNSATTPISSVRSRRESRRHRNIKDKDKEGDSARKKSSTDQDKASKSSARNTTNAINFNTDNSINTNPDLPSDLVHSSSMSSNISTSSNTSSNNGTSTPQNNNYNNFSPNYTTPSNDYTLYNNTNLNSPNQSFRSASLRISPPFSPSEYYTQQQQQQRQQQSQTDQIQKNKVFNSLNNSLQVGVNKYVVGRIDTSLIITFYITAITTSLLSYFLSNSLLLLCACLPVCILTLCVGAVGIHLSSSTLIRSALITSTSSSFCYLLLLLLTNIDYRLKCLVLTDLQDRILQNAATFDCEWGIVQLCQWNVIITAAAITQVRLYLVHVLTLISSKLQDREQLTGQNEDIGIALCCYIVSVANDGICPITSGLQSWQADPTIPIFNEKPKTNDLGCCSWLGGSTCCHQTVCRVKPIYSYSLEDARSDECHRLLGLLSCAPCKDDAGLFANSGYQNISVCSSFCTQIYSMCGGQMGKGNYCTPHID